MKITDKTLSCLDHLDATGRQLRKLCELLLKLCTDYIELSVDAYEKIGKLPPDGKYILKVDDVKQVQKYPEFDKFVCRRSNFITPDNVISEIQINDIVEINFLNQFNDLKNIRITGLDGILGNDYKTAFNTIEKNVRGKVELCPEDRYYCATAISVEWAISSGNDIVASFTGIGGYAPLEEVLMALRLEARYKPNMDYSIYPQIREIFEEITSEKISKKKAIIGKSIFEVEAGIHTDGISKMASIYEPFKPELVGNIRKFVLGKHSGKTTIIIKLKEIGIPEETVDISALLKAVKHVSILKQRNLNSKEFLEIIKLFQKKRSEKNEREKTFS